MQKLAVTLKLSAAQHTPPQNIHFVCTSKLVLYIFWRALISANDPAPTPRFTSAMRPKRADEDPILIVEPGLRRRLDVSCVNARRGGVSAIHNYELFWDNSGCLNKCRDGGRKAGSRAGGTPIQLAVGRLQGARDKRVAVHARRRPFWNITFREQLSCRSRMVLEMAMDVAPVAVLVHRAAAGKCRRFWVCRLPFPTRYF